MAGPWEKFQPAPDGPWSKFRTPPAEPAYSGAILPFSKDDEGNVSFDSNAGVVGTLKRAFTLPHEVMTGEVDPASEEGIGRVLEMGAVVTPVNPAVRVGDKAIPGVKRATTPAKPVVPTAEELKNAAGAGYNAARDMGVDYSAEAVRGLAGSIMVDLQRDGTLAELAPKSFALLKKLEIPPTSKDGSVIAPLSGVEAARRSFRNAAKDFSNPTEQLAAERIIRGLDDFVEAADPASVVAGPAAAAGKVQAEARANYAAGQRSDRITGVEEAAELRAAAANSGKNIGNTIRQRVTSILLDPKKRAGFSKEEIAALEKVAKGTASANTVRWVGNVLGGGGGLGTMISGGAGAAVGSAGGPLGAGIGAVVLPATGAAAKSIGNRMTIRAIKNADEAVRKRSPLYQERVQNPGVSVISPGRRALPGRAAGAAHERPAMTEEEYRIFLLEGGA